MNSTPELETTEVIKTKRLEIVDDEGESRAVLGKDDDQLIGLTLYDQTIERLKLKVRPNGNPEVILYDSDGKLRLKLFVNKRGEPKILLSDGYDNNIVKLAVSEDDESILELRDGVGDSRVALFVDDKGIGRITVFNDKGSLTGSLPKQAELLDTLGTVANVIKIIRAISGT